MPIVQLTQQLIPSLQCPDGKLRIEYCDRDLPGLVLEVRRNGGSTYQLRYKGKEDGKTKYAKIGRGDVVSLAEARKKARALKAEIQLGSDPRAEAEAKKAVITLDELWQHYLAYAKPRKRSFTRDEQLYRIRIQGKFGKMRLNQITRHQVQSFHTALLAEGLAPASADHHLKLLKRMFNLAHDWGMFEGSNPVARIQLANPDNKVDHLLNDSELQKLLTVLHTDENRPVCNIALFLLSTGARLNEALSAKWEHIDRQNRLWRIPASTSKSKKVKTIPLNDTALEILDHVGTEGRFEDVFVNAQTGLAYTTITRVWHRLRGKAGLPQLRLHDLRHQYASLLVSAGQSLYTVQNLLGHASPVTTQRYSHLSAKTLQAASNTASEIIREVMRTKQAA
ncbi:site-specific integrase [Ferriphaselus sp. R-1]|uniref:site-specific integrase n=1 Tax=Ferriphaselus sp. R-1 TaxID=1485544 RepID=UPI000555DCD4|nr:site-specific integrase [Ferriphaselus sp. R-1]